MSPPVTYDEYIDVFTFFITQKNNKKKNLTSLKAPFKGKRSLPKGLRLL